MSIEQDIKNWDGKSASDIGAIYSRFYNDDSFVSKIGELFRQEELQKASAWLLKKHLENGGKVGVDDISKLYKLLPKLNKWETKLLMLQCIPYMKIAKPEKKTMEMFLRKCLVDNNKFVRAWAYNGFYEMSSQYPEYVKEAKQFLEMAMRDEAPSVKARIRNILKSSSLIS